MRESRQQPPPSVSRGIGVNQVENSHQASEPFLSSILIKKSPAQLTISEGTN